MVPMRPKRKAVWCVLGAVLLAGAFYGIYRIGVRGDMTDFGVCYRNGRRVLDGETLYRASDGHLQFKYAPVAAFFYAPLSLLPWEAAKVVWYYLELGLLFGIFWLSFKLLPDRPKKPALVLAAAFLVLLKFIGREIELGQVNLLILFLLTSMIALTTRRKDAAAGVLWALSLFFKPYALVFLPYFLLKKRFKLVLAGAGVVLAGLALPALDYGLRGDWGVHGEWISSLSRSTPALTAAGDTASLYAFLWKALPGHPQLWVRILWIVFGLALGVLFLVMMGAARKRLRPAPEVLESAFLLILIPMASPLGWYYNYLYSAPAVILVICSLRELPKLGKWVVVADLIMIGASLSEVLGKSLFDFYRSYSLVVVNFLVGLAALAYLRLRRRSHL